jgi:hypothetical protein
MAARYVRAGTASVPLFSSAYASVGTGSSYAFPSDRTALRYNGVLPSCHFRRPMLRVGGRNGRGRCLRLRHRAAGIFRYLPPMNGARATTVDSTVTKGSWSEIFRNGLGLRSALVIGGIAMNATQMLVIAIIMPTIVRDIGGASSYTWAAMLYTIGAIVGGASTGMVWWRLGARRAQLSSRRLCCESPTACVPLPVVGRRPRPGTASPSLSLEDTSPPWSAGAARPECGHCWRRPRDSGPPGHGAHPGPMCRVAENHSRNPS